VSESARPEDWQLLGLEPGAGIDLVRRAYDHRRRLYEPGALATYTLMTGEESRAHLERLRAAFERIAVALAQPAAAPSAPARVETSAPPPSPEPPRPVEPPPDPGLAPGAFLKYHRERRGMSLEQVASITKIRRSLLAALEEHDLPQLLAPVYVRGFVVTYANLLGLGDPEALGRSYLALLKPTTERW
jgi:hypothetical protein